MLYCFIALPFYSLTRCSTALPSVSFSSIDDVDLIVFHRECPSFLSRLFYYFQLEYPAMIHVRSKLRSFQLFKDRLNEDRRTLFKTTCFGPWLDIIYVENDDVFIREFCILTGFKFGSISFREYRNGDILFRNRLFPENIGDQDAIRLCLLLSLEGEHIWRQLYDSIRNISSKHKFEHLAGLKRDPDHVQSYSLTGFLFAFKIWIIESSSVSDCWWTKVPKIIPRALPWRRKAEFNYFKQEDQIIRLVDQRQQDHISNMAQVAEQKIQSEIQRLYNHREARLNKIAAKDKQRKCLGHMNSSAHMKLAIERCVPKKRKYVDVLRSSFCALPKILNVPSIEQLANQKNVLNPRRIEKCKPVMGRCKFPWCNDITVDRSFWNGLCALDDNRKGWLLDE
nr:hypothetical protein [Tanacetum cinerariifolium]